MLVLERKNMKKIINVLILSLLLIFFSLNLVLAQEWSFAVISDNHGYYDKYRLVLEFIKELSENADPELDFILAAGDVSPAEENFQIYQDIFPENKPLYFPAAGNHELDCITYRFYISQEILLPLDDIIVRHDKMDLNYYFDWQNVRIIMLDQYSDFGIGNDRGWVTEAGTKWLKDTIESSPGEIEHIFIIMHEPPFARFRHTRGSISNAETDCWNMLLKHKRVKAVFCGHVHNYYKMRVKDASKAIKPSSGFTDEEGGLLMICSGSAGTDWESDNKLTVVQVVIDNKEVQFKTYQSPYFLSDFRLKEEWLYQKR
jgi:3',5'-cyclic AMP phosphodiesterase CpdA